jgi:hypothetical protein
MTPTIGSERPSMPPRVPAYVGDAAIKRLLAQYRCPLPFHAARMRVWGAIASPRPDIAPVPVFASLWNGDPPPFADLKAANAFFQTMQGFWNSLAALQDGSPPLRLKRIGKIDSRDAMHAAATLRVEELLEGFSSGFMGDSDEIDVPSGVGVRVRQVEEGTRLLAMMRNTFAAPPGADDAAMLAEFIREFPVVDAAVEMELNEIAVAVKAWRGDRLRDLTKKRTPRDRLH